MNRRLAVAFGAFVLLVLSVLISVSINWNRVSVDETITDGAKWGIQIGDTKEGTLARVRERTGIDGVMIAVRDTQQEKIRPLGDASTVRETEVFPFDEWILSSDTPYVDDLTLHFEGDILVRAHLRRQPFEFP